MRVRTMLIALCLPLSFLASGAERDWTCFQTGAAYAPDLDLGSDVAVVYGVGPGFSERAAGWRAVGYGVSMMTGISWGGYGDYYGEGEAFKKAEVQTRKDGRLFMHGNSTTVGYNVPTPAYVDYIKRYVDPAIDAGVQAIFLEEPEFWAEAGWSAAFQAEWERHYGEAWRAPDSSPDAQYQASKLKYELYFNALKEVIAHIKRRAAELGREIECHVPTHSLLNYAHWRIVSPESHLTDIEGMDGYIAQVWTGTSRTKNMYRGELKERTFETAFLEYGQMLGMVRPTGRKVWFLADPIEDNPNRSWADYKRNYECTIIASLMWPEVYRFEVMPWPERIFRGSYAGDDPDIAGGPRVGLSAEYATQMLTVINALNDMKQEDVEYDTGSRGIGVIVSDTLMFQRGQPQPSDAHLGSFYGLALPLLKHGVPVEPVQLENTVQPGALAAYRVLILTYEGQKPLRPEYHDALAEWVRGGGCLLYVGDGSDPYDAVREWWNEQGTTSGTPFGDLARRLEIGGTARHESVPCGAGWVRVFDEKPRSLALHKDGPREIIERVSELLARRGEALETRHYLKVRRGPYVIASVLDESISEAALQLTGSYIDLFDPSLPAIQVRTLGLNERTLLYDIAWVRRAGPTAAVLAAAARVRDERIEDGELRFTTRGPANTTARLRVLLPHPPRAVRLSPEGPVREAWDEASGTLWIEFTNHARVVDVAVAF